VLSRLEALTLFSPPPICLGSPVRPHSTCATSRRHPSAAPSAPGTGQSSPAASGAPRRTPTRCIRSPARQSSRKFQIPPSRRCAPALRQARLVLQLTLLQRRPAEDCTAATSNLATSVRESSMIRCGRRDHHSFSLVLLLSAKRRASRHRHRPCWLQVQVPATLLPSGIVRV
jgi:hypothetical protein